MQKHISLKCLLTALMAVCLTFFSTNAFGQGATTSAMSGFVTDTAGKPVAGAAITAIHTPTGTKVTSVTRANGQYNFSGLRLGGPYTVTVQAAGQEFPPRNDVYLMLNQTEDVSFVPGIAGSSEFVKMEAFNVSASTDTTFGAGRMGTGSNYSAKDIAGRATVRNNVQDIAALDSRINLNSLDQGGNMSAQGQNFRFNSFLIDGVEANDPYGLNANGFGSLRSPINMDSLQAISVELAPYDVRDSGFTGAQVKAVTVSGTNEFHGWLKADLTTQDLRASNPNPASPVYGQHERFNERTYSIGVNGPIIKDKLFFSLSYEDFRREAQPPSTQSKYVDQSQIDQIVARAKALGYDTGSLVNNSNVSTQKIYQAKIDWNISTGQTLSFSFRRNDGTSPTFPGYTTVFGQSFSNYWFQQPRVEDNYTLQLNSQWTPDFKTEATATYKDYDGSPKNNGKPFPSVTINGLTVIRGDTGATITSGSVVFGTEASRQLNNLNTKEKQAKLYGDYSMGDHTITIGGDVDSLDYYNAFIQNVNGTYAFTNVNTWLSGTPSSYSNSAPYAGYTLTDGIANWNYTAIGAVLQDVWKPNSQLTVSGGLRLDYPYIADKPPYNPAFTTAFGVRNDTTGTGNYTVAPRLGFNYKLKTERKTEIRGGLGLFQGRNPAVWISNSFSNAGAIGGVSGNVNGSGQPTLVFSPDPANQPTPSGTLPVPYMNITDQDFKQPLIWKGNVAVDHVLPFFGLVATAEYNATRTEKALAVEFLNFKTATTGATVMPDGRIRYAGNITPNYSTNANPTNVTGPYVPGTTTFPQTNTSGRRRVATFGDVFRLTNTNKGESSGVTLALSRPMKDNWSAGIAWTRGRSTEVSPMTSSTAGSLYSLRAVYNPNEDVASNSNTNYRDKIVASVTKRLELVKNYPTAITAIYTGQTGRPYSWVFKGDGNGDGYADNDLFYMPTGPNDSKVRWASTTERDDFFAFATANGLDSYKGSVVSRNSETSPWMQTIDLTVTQEIPLYKGVKTELIFQIVNLANLFNRKWGIFDEVPFSYKRRAAGAYFDAAANNGAGQYVYLFNQNTFDTIPTVADDTQVSRWQAKLAMKISF